MSKFVFVYHGGSHPQTPVEMDRVMAAWEGWFDSIGVNVIDGGNPVGMSTTVHSDGHFSEDGGTNPTSGYSLIEAENKEDAVKKAQTCPILAAGGSVEVAEAFVM